MTNKEAIELLKNAVPQDESLDEEGLFIEAFNMAIKAKKRQKRTVRKFRIVAMLNPWKQFLYRGSKPKSKNSEIWVMGLQAFRLGRLKQCSIDGERSRKEKDMDKTETYCKDCDRSIYGKYHDCDINIENNGKYVGGNGKCYCKIVNGKRAEKYPWEGEADGQK